MQRAFLPSFLLFTALTAGLTEARATGLTRPATVQDTIVMRLPNRATLTLTVRDAAQLRQLKNYHLDSLTTRLATYITQAEAAAKAGTTNQVTMRFYPDKDQPGQNLPEEIRITAHKPGTDGTKGPTKTQVFLNKKFGITTYNKGDGENSFTIDTNGSTHATAKGDSAKNASRRDRHTVDLHFEVGPNTFVNSSANGVSTAPPLRYWSFWGGSGITSFGLDYVQPLAYSKRAKLAITFGPEFTSNRFLLSGNNQWVKNGNITTTERAPDSKQIDDSRLVVNYLNLPIMLRLKLRNKEDKRTLSAGIGAFGGYRVGGNITTEYKLAGSDNKHEDKLRGDLNVNDWQYGLQGELGFHFLRFFAKYNLNEVFQTGQGPQTHALSFGFRFIGF
ncbi:porin family protein [Hymenobacter negativus]|uniref:Outer membrane beta-barrel protein n=1 Tax=Hymenobacter negativus TaxID=2795026 RepID=A0ABS0Q371_9BACT|nr:MULTISPECIES: outer membrane beta-barrel protein [Bacteria]MBH8557069.1 outer membrane beta-barrel protein [Hymenobacter negativus]MBH8569310.1 outer membrane beta-barrel protein [Hymenobacter negativus]MBR7209045.1 outer membrane beta-barrel protein [Microvirga sp. STS02]